MDAEESNMADHIMPDVANVFFGGNGGGEEDVTIMNKHSYLWHYSKPSKLLTKGIEALKKATKAFIRRVKELYQ